MRLISTKNFLPPIAAIIAVILVLQLLRSVELYLFPGDFFDQPFLLEPLWDIEVFYPFYLVSLLAALLFQWLAAQHIIAMYAIRKHIFKLTYWQLILAGSLAFGTLTAFITWPSIAGFWVLAKQIAFNSIVAIAYWLVNLSVLRLLKRQSK